MAPRKNKKGTDTTGSGTGPVTRSKADPKKEVDVTFYSKLRNYEASTILLVWKLLSMKMYSFCCFIM